MFAFSSVSGAASQFVSFRNVRGAASQSVPSVSGAAPQCIPIPACLWSNIGMNE